MEPIWQWGLAFIIAVQSIDGAIFNGFFRIVSFLGEEEFYLMLFPALLWCIDAHLGWRIGIVFLLSVYFNSLAKDLIAHPRPYDMNPSVKLGRAEGYGLPSGHAQNAAVVWGGIAAWTRKPGWWVGAILVVGLIGFSRIYLGVHFPTDVLVGWAIGASLLAIAVGAESPITAAVRQWPLSVQIGAAIAGPAILALLFPSGGTISAMGALAGALAGLAISWRSFTMTAAGPWWKRLVRLIVGMAVLIVLYVGARLVLPSGDMPLHLIFRFVRYALLGLWISLGAPWMFDRFHLAQR